MTFAVLGGNIWRVENSMILLRRPEMMDHLGMGVGVERGERRRNRY